MNKLLASILSLMSISPIISTAQNKTFPEFTLSNHQCGFTDVLSTINYPYEQTIQSYQSIINDSHLNKNKGTGAIYDIPVVIHVVYSANTPQLNLDDSVLKNQIEVLTKAFRKQHADTANIRAIFKPLSQDAEIQFHLATTDPNGNPTNGITRTITTIDNFGTNNNSLDSLERVKKSTAGGIDPWPTTKYLNIWVANLSNAQGQMAVLGYAIPPLNPIPSHWPAGSSANLSKYIDGVVIQSHAFGDNNQLSSALQGFYTKGRCTVHEVGHYLGLMHTWGSGGGNTTAVCGLPAANDGVQDTPEQSLISRVQGACPSNTKNSCGSGASDLPDLWENYMDYNNDACQTMFTANQITIMRSVLGNQRNTLTGTAGVANITPKSITVFPNPTTSNIKIDTKEKISTIEVFDLIGSTVLNIVATPTNTYDVSALPTGNYILKMTSQNGDVFTGKFVVVK